MIRKKRRPVTHLPNRWPWNPKLRQHVVVAVRRGRPAVILCGKRRFKVDKISTYDASKADCPACIEAAATSVDRNSKRKAHE